MAAAATTWEPVYILVVLMLFFGTSIQYAWFVPYIFPFFFFVVLLIGLVQTSRFLFTGVAGPAFYGVALLMAALMFFPLGYYPNPLTVLILPLKFITEALVALLKMGPMYMFLLLLTLFMFRRHLFL